MAVNDFLPFAYDVTANVESQATYAADSQRPIGNQPGVARAEFVNKTLRQTAAITSGFAQYLANTTGNDVLDDGNASTLLATITAAFTQSVISLKNSNYPIVGTDGTILADASGGTFTLTLPAASGLPNKIFKIRRIDNTMANQVIISGSIYSNGAAATDWKLYTVDEEIEIQALSGQWYLINHNSRTGIINQTTLTITATTTNPTKGTTSKDVIAFSREGNFAIIPIQYVQTGAGSNGSGDYLIQMPAGLTIDTTYINLNTTVPYSNNSGLGALMGKITMAQGNTDPLDATAVVYDSTHVRIAGIYQVASLQAWGSSAEGLSTTSLQVNGWFKAPIANWKP